MASNIMQILTLFLILVLFIATYLAILYAITKVFILIYKWLRTKPWFRKTISRAQSALQRWWRKNLPGISALSEFFATHIIDLIFYGWVVVVLYDTHTSISQYIMEHPEYSYFQKLDEIMNTDPNFYMVMMVIAGIWLFCKMWQRRSDIDDKEIIRRSLKNIEKSLGCYEEPDIGAVNKKIRENLRRINKDRK
jgi:hypothetical protein